MQKESILTSARNAGLDSIADQIARLARPSIRLASRPLGREISPSGASRMGGQPDLPPGTPWPAWKGAPMAFVLQVRLEDARPFDPTGLLPPAGLLSFFYDSKQETYGADPEDRGGWKVFYYNESPANFVRFPYPAALPPEARFHPCALSFSSELTLPFAPKQIDPTLDWSEEQVLKYEDYRASFPTPDDYRQPHNRMFGYPDQIQDDMQLQSALVASGFRSIDDPRAKALETQKQDWLLLLQVDSDPNAGMRWASSGMLYAWIERQALKERAFDRTWLILQSE